MHRTLLERLKSIQRRLRIEPDGEPGAQTITALENALDELEVSAPAEQVRAGELVISKRAMDQLVAHEIGSKAYYERALRRPVWPGADSGVTIGIGYDLGYQSEETFRADWAAHLPASTVNRLAAECGYKGGKAKKRIAALSDVSVPLGAATAVFEATVLPRYVARTRKAFPGVEHLAPDAAGALLSLVYNRGPSMKGESRKEMRAIRELVPRKDYAGIARELRAMKRIWEGRGLAGLLKRRDDEADLVELGSAATSDTASITLVA